MEAFVAARDAARKKAGVADHILTQTYPLVQDPKLLIAVLQNTFEAVEAGIGALLLYEQSVRRLPTVPDGLEPRLSLFRQHVAQRYRIPPAFLRFVGELQEIMREHRQSPVEFVRNNQFVICNESYRIRTLNAEMLKRHVQRAKAFVSFVEEKVNRNDAVIARRD